MLLRFLDLLLDHVRRFQGFIYLLWLEDLSFQYLSYCPSRLVWHNISNAEVCGEGIEELSGLTTQSELYFVVCWPFYLSAGRRPLSFVYCL